MRNIDRYSWKPAVNPYDGEQDGHHRASITLRSAPAPMSDWTYRLAALTAALLLLATAGGAL